MLDNRPIAQKIFGSRKVWVAIGSIVSVLLATRLPSDQVGAVIFAIMTIGSVVIAAIGYEDGQQKRTDINVGQSGSTTLVSNGTANINPPSSVPPPSLNGLALLLVLPALALAGCVTTPTPGFAAADRATYDAIAPAYIGYVSADPTLTLEQKARRQRTVETWRMRIGAQELATTQPAR